MRRPTDRQILNALDRECETDGIADVERQSMEGAIRRVKARYGLPASDSRVEVLAQKLAHLSPAEILAGREAPGED